MALPVFAPFPPPAIQSVFPAEEWKQCLSAWTILSNAYLKSPDKTFKAASDTSSFAAFLLSFYEQWSQASRRESPLAAGSDQLKEQCFKLLTRCRTVGTQETLFLDLAFLANFARAHLKTKDLQQFLAEVWQDQVVQRALQKWKVSVIGGLESGSMSSTRPSLAAITPLLYSCEYVARFLLTGSDFLEAAMQAYISDSRPAARKTLVVITYIGLTSLIKNELSNIAALTDHLYNLKTQADTTHDISLLADLVTNTPLLKVVKRNLTGKSPERLTKMLETLLTYNTPSIARKRRRTPHNKGKTRMHQVHDDIHIHRMSFVSQIQDLFPDLGAGFVMRLLDEYNDNVEQITAHLLDDSLPDHLHGLDRHEQADIMNIDQEHAMENLAPRSTPPIPDSFIPHRANVYDNDDFDRLAIDTSKLHIGKKEDELVESTSASKAAIIAALAAFDSDDDERDDTYDIEDVGGTVDTAQHDGDDTAVALPIDESDIVLYRHYQTEPAAFGRAAEIRRSKVRAELKLQTGMTDEMIEGWAIMLQRDSKRRNRLAMESNKFDGRQNEVARTSYREQHLDSENDTSDAGERGSYRARGRGRGRGGRGRGRGGSVAGPSDDAATANAQRRKEANKGSRANHNRRDQRAKKMARGGFTGAS